MAVTLTSEPRQNFASIHSVINRIQIIDTDACDAALITRLTQAGMPLIVSFVNQNVLNLAWGSFDFVSYLAQSDVLLRDGVGMAVCMAALGRRHGRNMNGTDFIPRLAAAFAGRSTVLFGTADPWTSRAAAALERLGCRIVSTMDGFRLDDDYVSETLRVAPELIILAMGNPRQEAVAKAIASATMQPMVIVNGGAIADFLAQRFERAPLWLRRARCEWIFRLFVEPRRLWRRYLLGGLSFSWRILQLRMALR
jgi:exopolysaccharide biosynthesis WecB/TagA/CpsF family protein